MYTVYILKSQKTGRYYIGHTSDINQRLKRHNLGKNKSTRLGRPWKLILAEEYSDKESAWLREQQIKSYKGGEVFKKLIGSV